MATQSASVKPALPRARYLLWPTLKALEALGGSGTVQEIAKKVPELEKFTSEQQSILHGDGPQTEIEYRLAWARTYLKTVEAVDNSSRGVWTITDKGRHLRSDDMAAIPALVRARRPRRERKRGTQSPADNGEEEQIEDDWKDRLLQLLVDLAPDGFERLAQRLLREAGFISVTVTGRSGDGGIDGLGIYRMSLVGFPVFFQCKRYRGSVRASAVRDFRGAMSGRGDKGLLITTGTFTGDALHEATRQGAPPIDLIDGDQLCELLKRYSLGVRTVVREVEDVELEPNFFDNL